MHITRATDDPEFRETAKAVHLHAEDIILMKVQVRSWWVPLEQLSATPTNKRLYRFEKTKVRQKRLCLRVGPCVLTT